MGPGCPERCAGMRRSTHLSGRPTLPAMARYFDVHPDNPQPRAIGQMVDLVRGGGLIAYPTDSCFALGCQLGDREGIDRIRTIRQPRRPAPLHAGLPGLRPARPVRAGEQRGVPRGEGGDAGQLHVHPARHQGGAAPVAAPAKKTVGVRIPRHTAAQAMLAELGEPLLSAPCCCRAGGAAHPGLGDQGASSTPVDAVVDSGDCGMEPTTVVDLSGDEPEIVRRGAGDPSRFE